MLFGADFFNNLGALVSDLLFYTKVFLIIVLLYSELSHTSHRINKTPAFIALLLLLLITTLEPALKGLFQAGFDPLNIRWYFNLLIVIGIPIYVILALTRKKRRA